jgi:hypothetical protein
MIKDSPPLPRSPPPPPPLYHEGEGHGVGHGGNGRIERHDYLLQRGNAAEEAQDLIHELMSRWRRLKPSITLLLLEGGGAKEGEEEEEEG